MSALKRRKTTLMLDEEVFKKIKILSTLEDESMVSFIRKAVEERIERLTDQDRKDTIINLMAFSQDQTSSYTEDDLVESSVSEVRKYRSSKK